MNHKIITSATDIDLNNNAKTVLEKRYLKKDNTGQVIEKPVDLFTRVASTVTQAERKFRDIDDYTFNEMVLSNYKLLTSLRFLPNTPTLMNAGRELGQLSACFVLPIHDSMESIFDTLKHAALIHKSGGGTGFSFTNLRPSNDLVKSTKGVSSGPISFMKVFDAATDTIKQGGARRGANMGILRVDHPDILDFIKCKQVDGILANFNISIAITDEFMTALESNTKYNLYNPRDNSVQGTLRAKDVFNLLVKSAWSNGEPGIIFIDKINKCNPTPKVGLIESTNPCQPEYATVLTPQGIRTFKDISIGSTIWSGKTWTKVINKFHTGIKPVYKYKTNAGEFIGTEDHRVVQNGIKIRVKDAEFIDCNNDQLTEINTFKIVSKEYIEDTDVYDITVDCEDHTYWTGGCLVSNCGEQPLLPYESCNLGSINLNKFVIDKDINWDSLEETVKESVRFLDNVIQINQYPLDIISSVTLSNRKIGLGVMGWADMLYRLSVPYNSDKALNIASKLMEFINDIGHEASSELAKERGNFSNWDLSIYGDNNVPMRNATVTTIAPTGTLSIIAGCSGGIEPVFSLAFYKKVIDSTLDMEVHPTFINALKERKLYNTKLMDKIAKTGSIQHIKEIPQEIKDVFVVSHDIAPEWHVKMQSTFQRYTDNAVSKTVNLPNEATVKDVIKVFLQAYNSNCKGITVYRDGSRNMQVYNIGKKKK